MSIVFPGVEEVIARFLRPVNILMRLDFPTLERPMKAYSGNVPVGHFCTSVLLMTNSAFVISICLLIFSLIIVAKLALILRKLIHNIELYLSLIICNMIKFETFDLFNLYRQCNMIKFLFCDKTKVDTVSL